MSKVKGPGGRRTLPYAFTQEGIAMLSSVLRSDRAVQVNISIMRVFAQLREWFLGHKDLEQKLNALEETYETRFKVVFDAIRNSDFRKINSYEKSARFRSNEQNVDSLTNTNAAFF
jgi:hypothetical protein